MEYTKEIDELIASRIKERREQLKLTQEFVAKACKVATSTIQRIENHEVRPSRRSLECIARVLNMSVEAFYAKDVAYVEKRVSVPTRTTPEEALKVLRDAVRALEALAGKALSSEQLELLQFTARMDQAKMRALLTFVRSLTGNNHVQPSLDASKLSRKLPR